MKKNVFSLKNTVLAMICALSFFSSACSNNVVAKTDISVNVPKEVIQRVVDEAAREVALPADAKCTVIAFLYIDSYADPWDERHGTQIKKEIPVSEINDMEFNFTEVYVGAELISRVIVSCGTVSYSGWSEKQTLRIKKDANNEDLRDPETDEFIVEGNELTVELQKDAKSIQIENNTYVPFEEFEIIQSPLSTDANGNEYWEFKLPEEAKEYDCIWSVDEETQSDTTDSLKLYKALMSKGIHTISFAGVNGTKKCSGQTTIPITKESKERFVFIPTDKGLEFRINKFAGETVFDSIELRERSTQVMFRPEMNQNKDCYTGCWPFVDNGKTYEFDVWGNWGEPKGSNNDDYYKNIIVSADYKGSRNSAFKEANKEYANIIMNYARNKQYTLKEKKSTEEGEPNHVIFNYEQTDKMEVFNLFDGLDVEVTNIRFELNFVYRAPNLPDDWIGGISDNMIYAGDINKKFVDIDTYERFYNTDKTKFKNKMEEIGNDDYEAQFAFTYRIKGISNQTFKFEAGNPEDDGYRTMKVERVRD